MVRQRMDDSRPADAVNPLVDLTAYDAVILDFDGPMCNVFAGYPAATVARELKDRLAKQGSPPEAMLATSDPHQILRLVHTYSPDLTPTIESALTTAELAAIESATSTPDLSAFISNLHSGGTHIAVASNNSADAIQRWLSLHGLEVDYVVGRDPRDPAKMKPAPDILLQALASLNLRPTRVIFIGDSTSDAQAAFLVGIPFVGFANKPHKNDQFFGPACIATIVSLKQLMTPDSDGPKTHNKCS